MERLNRAAASAAVVLVPLSLLLGFIGYLSLGSGPHPVSDAAFAAVQLFALDAPPDIAQHSFILNVARFLAPASLALATGAALVALLGQSFRRASLRWRGRGHVVLLGVDDSSALLARALLEQGTLVVIADTEESSQLSELQRQGAITFVLDARESASLRRCRVERASHVVVSGRADTHTLELTEGLAAALDGHRDASVHCAIQDETLWRQLGRLEIAQTNTAGSHFEFLNPADRKAAAFLHLVLQSLSGRLPASLHVEADGAVGRRLFIRLALHLASTDSVAAITVTGEVSRSLVEPLMQDEPWIATVLDFQLEPQPGMSVGLVCSERHDGGPLGLALEWGQNSTIQHVFVCAAGREGQGVLNLKRLSPRVTVINADKAWLSPEEFFGRSWTEVMARARHDDYYANEIARGQDPETNPSLVPWGDLPESLRESNRAFARAVGSVLADLNAHLVPLRGFPTGLALPAAEMEALARDEHDRWMSALVSDGWTYAEGPKDPHRRTHPLLVPWEELDEAEREKDRDSIRAIPRMLARVGFALELSQPSDEDRGLS